MATTPNRTPVLIEIVRTLITMAAHVKNQSCIRYLTPYSAVFTLM